MKIFKSVIILLFLFSAYSCNFKGESTDNEELTSNDLKEFESKLTEKGYFWSCGSREYLFLSDKDKTVISYRPQTTYEDRNDSETHFFYGKWYFDIDTQRLTVAWNREAQFSAKPYFQKDNWSIVALKGSLGDHCSSLLTRMKLIDNRFEQAFTQ